MKKTIFNLIIGAFILSINNINAQDKMDKETVYLVFDFSKFAERKAYNMSFSEGLYTRYIDDKNPNIIIFERKHRYASSAYDTFIFDRKKHTPKRVSKEEVKSLKVLSFDEIENILIKKNMYDTPQVLYPNLGIIEIASQNVTIYVPIKWERSVSIE